MSLIQYRDASPRIAESVFVAPGAWIIGDVEIGERSGVWFNTVIRGDMHYVRIGSFTAVQDSSTLHVTHPGFPLLIGDRVVIGHRAVVHGCTVEDECLIGIGAIVLDGVKIGAGSIVAAGALLPPGMEVPPGSVVMGAPARVIRQTGEKEKNLLRGTWSHYADLAAEYMKQGLAVKTRVRGFLG